MRRKDFPWRCGKLLLTIKSFIEYLSRGDTFNQIVEARESNYGESNYGESIILRGIPITFNVLSIKNEEHEQDSRAVLCSIGIRTSTICRDCAT